ncbi:MAG: MazG family protein [Nostocoides sp.]
MTGERGRLTVLVTSPRVAPGLLTRDAWAVLEAAAVVHAAAEDEPLVVAVTESGIRVTPMDPETSAPYAARLLVAAAAGSEVVWLGSADGDPGLTDAIANEVSRVADPPEVEVLVGSWDVPGARLLDVVAVMDRLRSPGGCPWDAEQTHESLLPYLHEEAGEYEEAVRSGDQGHMAEELGDVLLQVAFHARVAQEHPTQPFDIDDVAGHLVDKLVRRHPHVFADGDASTPAEVEEQWARIKAEEKAAEGR